LVSDVHNKPYKYSECIVAKGQCDRDGTTETPQRLTMLKESKGVTMLYKVKAKINETTLKDFFLALNDGSVETQKPDGRYIVKAMREAVMLDEKTIEWYEGCYCETALKHERETVYDKYLTDFETQMVCDIKDDLKGTSFWEYMEEIYQKDSESA